VNFWPPPLPVVKVVDAFKLVARDRSAAQDQVLLEQFVTLRRIVTPGALSWSLTLDRYSNGKEN